MSVRIDKRAAVEVERLLESTGALLRGHFKLSSGLHSDRYCQCARLFEDPASAGRVAGLMAQQLAGVQVDVVLAPALGGILWGYELARALGVRSVFAERVGTDFTLRRGFALAQSERVLLAEDVITTGKSVMELAPLVEAAGAQVVGIAAVVDRSKGSFAPAGIPVWAMCQLEFNVWEAKNVPPAIAEMPAVKPGSRPGASTSSAV
ncbi:MAG: orotate phosphoribosyltransferase [Phycisphaerales bacterium]|nr:orotate phosphoribosyltransferase [Phycisphaerales bacterium]